MSRLLAATASAAFLVGMAFSANAQVFAPLTDSRSAYDWSGFYLGSQFGWGWADQHLDDGAGLDAELGLNGGFFGPVIGYQKQWNNWVVGAEMEANWSDIDGQDSLPGAVGRTFGGVEIFGSAGAKLGVGWNRLLLYATGGLSGAETESLQRNGPNSSEDHAASFGWMAGGGVDFALTSNIVLGLQYRHYDFGEADFDMGFLPDRTGETDLDTISGHVVFKLNGL
jgi:outer membrane immunogenic protein